MSENLRNDLREPLSTKDAYMIGRNIEYIRYINGDMTAEEMQRSNSKAKGEIVIYLFFFAIIGILVLLSKLGII